MKTLEIYFNDLNEKTQKEVLEFYNITSGTDLNLETFPLFILECERDN